MPLTAQQNMMIGRNFQFLKHKLNSRKIHVEILRVCQLISYEARHVFYDGNELRFSGIDGWMVASAFLYTIGGDNYSSLGSPQSPSPI
jgi:hypothetical protein